MDYYYQLVTLGDVDELSENILDVLWRKIDELGIAKKNFKIINEISFASYVKNCPTYCLYFGSKTGNFQSIAATEKLIQTGSLILPIFFEENKFAIHIPKILEKYNGFLYNNANKIESIVALILEGWGLLRSSRKLFISYKRTESRSVAIQLYEEFEKNGFDVFLDTHSIKPGDIFQDELWHRMTDCDVIVVLNTPNFLNSFWCKEEIAEANGKLIGIVQLVWPNHKLENIAELCLPISLKDSDFVDKIYDDKNKSLFSDHQIDKIISNVESVRARNLVSRQNSIINELLNTAQSMGIHLTLQPERYLSQKLSGDQDRIYIPTVGIPQSFDCNRSEELINNIAKHKVANIYLVYDHIRIRDQWLKHLAWLNDYLKVQTRQIKDVQSWLTKN
ncbi:MAG: toll/interleukin-1 receptor domain-containing protein [Bacteroidetes bacterium]|nr:toll/interleukin-1 receptor domain-containing protein [Bacteroidota bacterium]